MTLERDVEKACDDLAMQCGYLVKRLSQRRASRVIQGLPDRRYLNLTLGVAFWFEVKAPAGQISREQYEFLADELRCGCLGSRGGLEELIELMRAVKRGHAFAFEEGMTQLEVWRFKGFRGERKPKTGTIVPKRRAA
jgi:hypothetical protein